MRQATMRSTFGMSEPHRRKTSGVQAARWASVPTAKLLVECRLVASEIITVRRPVKRGAVAAMRLMAFSLSGVLSKRRVGEGANESA